MIEKKNYEEVNLKMFLKHKFHLIDQGGKRKRKWKRKRQHGEIVDQRDGSE